MKASPLAAVVALAVALSLAAGAAAAGGLFSWASPYRAECPPAEAPLGGDKSLGVNSDLSAISAAERDEALSAMRRAGLRWLRQRFPWDRIEPERGRFDWAVWDAVVADVEESGLRLIAVLDGSPAWARAADDMSDAFGPPHETRDYGSFVSAFAARYGDVIDYYEIWDEPNIAPHWGSRWVDPSAYLRLLREGAIQARTADPGSVVLLGALAPNIEPGGANMSDLLYLDALYRLGAGEWFDVVAAEPYGFGQGAKAPAELGATNFARAELLRAVMQAQGDWDTPVWAVAFGWADASTRPLGLVDTVRDAVGRARSDWPWMGPMLWAAWLPSDRHGQLALDQGSKVEGQLLKELPRLSPAKDVATSGTYGADHPSGRYEGKWRVTPAGADIGATGDRVEISFSGTRLDLRFRSGGYRAILYVAVDGLPSGALPRDGEGRSYLVLYDPAGVRTASTVARSLAPGRHVVELVAEGGWGQWSISGWSVCSEQTGSFPWLPLGLAGGSAAALAVAVLAGWSWRLTLLASIGRAAARYRALDYRFAWTVGVLATVLLYISVGTVPDVLALALLACVLFLRPEVGLSLIALALPVWQPGKALFGKVFSLVEILTWLTVAGWAAGELLRTSGRGEPGVRAGHGRRLQDRIRALHGLDWGVVALLGLASCSLIWAEHGREAARELRTVILGSVVFYALVRTLARNQAARWRVVDSWVLGGALISLVAIGQWLFGRNLITADDVWRVRGFYGSPNNLALYLGRILPLAVGLAWWGTVVRRRWPYAAAGLLASIAIGLTYSRGAWLLGVPLSILSLAAIRGRRSFLAVLGGCLIAAVIALLASGPGRLASLADTEQGTTFLRLQLWHSSLAMIRDHPVLGVGLDNFLYHYRSGYLLPTAWAEPDLSHPHNVVLDFWLRLGLPGLAVFIWLLVRFARRSWSVWRGDGPANQRLLAAGLLSGMVSVLAHGMVDNAFFLVDLSYEFMLMLALVQGLPGNDGLHAGAHEPAEE